MTYTNVSNNYNCDFSNIKYGYDTKSLKNNFERTEYIILNPNVYNGKLKNSNTNIDPKLYNGLHNQWITLDNIPLDCSMKIFDIPYDTNLNKYGQNYKSYHDINAGQIMYYIDNTISQPFFYPNFVNNGNNSNIDGVLYKDSMDSIKPQYFYNQIKNDNPITISKNSNKYKLSFLEDTTNNREELMSLQMSKINQQKYSSRYFLK